MLLVIDSSSKVDSIAIFNEDKLIASSTFEIPSSRSERLADAISYIIKMSGIEYSDIDKIAILDGPGSFIGRRIAIATALGIKESTGANIYTFNKFELSKFYFNKDGYINKKGHFISEDGAELEGIDNMIDIEKLPIDRAKILGEYILSLNIIDNRSIKL